MFESPATHCQPLQIEAVAAFAIGRAAVQLLLGARYVIVLSHGGELLVLQADDLTLWWDEPLQPKTCL